MSILARLYSEGGSEVILHTVEIQCDSWLEPITLVRDYIDHEIMTEDKRRLTAKASGMNVALPKRDNRGAQKLTFAIDGVRYESTVLIRDAIAAQQEIRLIYRVYTSDDLSAPAKRPYHFYVHTIKSQAERVELTAGLFDFIDMRWPRQVFDSENAPCLKFSQ